MMHGSRSEPTDGPNGGGRCVFWSGCNGSRMVFFYILASKRRSVLRARTACVFSTSQISKIVWRMVCL